MLAADYVQVAKEGRTALVVSPTHAEGARITAEIRHALQESGAIGSDARHFAVLQPKGLTEAERGDQVNYQAGDVLVFHQNATGHTRGDRIAVDNERTLPFELANRFELFHSGELELAPGDWVRITRNGATADKKHRLDNGTLYKVREFDAGGNIVLDNGWTVDKEFGHLAHGYVVTSHASQGRNVQVVLVGQGAESFPASSREQFYVSVSRGREEARIYTSDKEALSDAIRQSEERLSATELVAGAVKRSIILRQVEETHDREPERKKERELAYGY
jgi:ATP-dependent exoDNAse (exonuclease V) alpha subunit